MKKNLCSIACSLLTVACCLLATACFSYDRQDQLRGGNGTGRNWWDVQHYILTVDFDTAAQSIKGSCVIHFKITATPGDSLQLDLQDSMVMDEVSLHGHKLQTVKDGNVWWVTTTQFRTLGIGTSETLTVTYHGVPRKAVRPPWDGGLVWTKDSVGKPWIAVACQGLGASVWWPCKDYQADEPDNGMILWLEVPKGLDCISNGRGGLSSADVGTKPAKSLYRYEVKNPINNYDATFYIGDYVHWSDTLMGEKGRLDMDFYALRYNEAKAREQFAVTRQMLHCFEYWMGPYPFYEDGYKLVEAPYLGMEHQGAVAYGNEYKMGYMGRDRSNTGLGLKFDFIIVHESGHEWFGNNITAKDIADNWIHEGFTTYTEGLFAECLLGREKSFDYIRGEWANIRNDNPVIGPYGLNAEGSSDMYDKGSAVVHMIRIIMGDEIKFRQLLRSLNGHFYHKTVTEQEFENYINTFTGIDFTPLFNQYLRTSQVPVLEYYRKRKVLYYRFTNAVPGLILPVNWQLDRNTPLLSASNEWQHVKKWKKRYSQGFNKELLVRYRQVPKPEKTD